MIPLDVVHGRMHNFYCDNINNNLVLSVSHKLAEAIPLSPTATLPDGHHYSSHVTREGTEARRGIQRSGSQLGQGWDLNSCGLILVLILLTMMPVERGDRLSIDGKK